MSIEPGWCPSGCTLADRCYTNVASYSSSETLWNNALTSGRYCLQGTASSTGTANQSPTVKYAGGQYNEENPPTIDQIKAELTTYIDPNALSYKYADGPFYMRAQGTTVKVSGETFTDWCSGGEITIGDMWWTGTWWAYYFIVVWESYMVLKLCDGWECPHGSEVADSICVALPGYEWNEDCQCFVPIYPGIPDGPDPTPELLPPSMPPGDPENPVCPDCYTYDAVTGLCVYDDTLPGCSDILDCISTAGCDTTHITGVCEGRDDCI